MLTKKYRCSLFALHDGKKNGSSNNSHGGNMRQALLFPTSSSMTFNSTISDKT